MLEPSTHYFVSVSNSSRNVSQNPSVKRRKARRRVEMSNGYIFIQRFSATWTNISKASA